MVANKGRKLQWGHGTNAVESFDKIIIHVILDLASMGPRHECRGEV